MGLLDLLAGVAPTQHALVKNVNPNNEESKSKLSEEIIASGLTDSGAAAIEAAKAYDNAKKPETHALAQKKLDELVDTHVDKLVEKKKLDAFDKEKTKRLAKEHAQAALKRSGQV